MKALKTYWGNLSGKTATAKGVAQKAKKDVIPGRQHEDAVQTGANRKAQESRLATRKQQEADWPRNQDGTPRAGKRKVAAKGKKRTHAQIVGKIRTLEQQIKDGTLTSTKAKAARAELGRATDELASATKDVASAKSSRKVTRIATGAVAGTAAAGATYANRDKMFSEIISNRLVNIELALDERLSEIEFGLARAARVAVSKSKAGKGFADYSAQEAKKLNYSLNKHAKRRAKFLRAGGKDAGVPRGMTNDGSMVDAALKAQPRWIKKEYAKLSPRQRRLMRREAQTIPRRIRGGEVKAVAEAKHGEAMLKN
jgi:predicted metal-dependent hydrolase